MRAVASLLAAAAAYTASAGTLPGSTVPNLNIDTDSMTVSGISSGAFMAVQMHVAFSSSFHTGVGVIAGGPFWCAMDSLPVALSSCMDNGYLIDTDTLQNTAIWTAYWGFADPTSNMKDSKVWVLSAQQDTVVDTEVVKKLQQFYTTFNSDPTNNIKGVYNISGEHSQLTLEYGNDCTELGEPYLNKCDYDGAGNILQHMYSNSLVAPSGPTAWNGTIYSYDQSVYFDGEVWASTFGMYKTGYIYVPKACELGVQCKLHVAFHGCEMSPSKIGTQYVVHGGYNSWADANNIVILYPQAVENLLNPKGCWDWWSYSGLAYASNIGSQTLAVKRMVDALAGWPRTANATTCTSEQEAHIQAVLGRAAAVDVSQTQLVAPGRFRDAAVNELLGNELVGNSSRCWPSGGIGTLFPTARAALPNMRSGLRGA